MCPASVLPLGFQIGATAVPVTMVSQGCEMRGLIHRLLAVALGWVASLHAVRAEEPGQGVGGMPTASIAASLPDNGDPSGRRKALADRGVTFVLYYTNDVLANVEGGQKRGTIDQGKLEGALTVDLAKAAGWQGLTLFANGFQLHNTGRIHHHYTGGINTVAAIEAVPTTRLSELWLERSLADGVLTVRAGQLAADTEFFFSNLSAHFLQSDWPTIAAANLPSGGPAYPLATPGARVKLEPSSALTLLLAVFNGDPAGPGEGDEQLRNRYGLNFRVRDPALVIGEAQFRRNQARSDPGLASTLKLGGWGHFGRFDDQRRAIGGSLLADPNGSGAAIRHQGNWGIYGIVDQQIYRPQGGDAESGLSVFGRVSASPSDRNLVSFFFDAGILIAGLVPGRPDDKLGASFMYTRFSDGARAFDRDVANFSGAYQRIRDFDANLEISYAAQILPGWIVQPMATYVWHPSFEAGKVGEDAVVVGARSFWKY